MVKESIQSGENPLTKGIVAEGEGFDPSEPAQDATTVPGIDVALNA